MLFNNLKLFFPFIDDKIQPSYLKKISYKFTEEVLWRRIFSLATSQSKQHFIFFIINYSFVCERIGSPRRSIFTSVLNFVSLNLCNFFHILSIFDCPRTLVSYWFWSRLFFIFILNFLFNGSLRNLRIFFYWRKSVR